jgi:hypothetical protein
MGEGSTEFPLPCARALLTEEVWAFIHPSDQNSDAARLRQPTKPRAHIILCNFRGSRESSRASFFCAVCKDTQYKIIKIKYAVTIMAVTPAMESTKASWG